MSVERTLGDAIVERLRGVELDARAKAAARAFTTQHKRFVTAETLSDAKASTRSTALAAIGEADEALDALIGALADKLIGHGVAKRSTPFAGLSKYSPSVLCELGYGNQVTEAGKLTKAVRKKKGLPRAVLDACDAVDRSAARVKALLPAYDRAHKAWKLAITQRDALLLDWQKALTRFRVLAKASLVDRPGEYEALVAPPEAIAVLRSRPRSRKTSPARPATEGVESGS